MYRIAKFFPFLLSVCIALSAEIIEIDSLSEIKHYIEANDHIILEIYPSLISSSRSLGNPLFLESIKEKEKFLEKFYIQNLFTSNCNEKLFEDLKEKGAVFTGVCKAPYASIPVILRTLDNLGIQKFQEPSLAQISFSLKEALATKGIIFMSQESSLPSTLLQLLPENTMPRRIVMVSSELLPMVEFRQKLEDTEFLGLYLRSARVPLDEERSKIAEIQLRYLGKVLPDYKAKILARKEASLPQSEWEEEPLHGEDREGLCR